MIEAPIEATNCSGTADQTKPPAEKTSSALPWLAYLEWVTAALVLVVTVALHLRFVTHVGGLWRDEANSVNLATLPSSGEMVRFLGFDSFPILHFELLRMWTWVFGPENDSALRALGFITGISLIGVLVANARSFGSRLPVLALALLGLNPIFIRYVDSTRAFGLGIVLILLTLRSFWRLLDSSSASLGRRTPSAAIFALLSVHTLYYNSVLLLAISAGAIAVAVRRREWRTGVIILGIGLMAAVSLLVYLPMILRIREWKFLLHYPSNFRWLWTRSCELIGSPLQIVAWFWVVLSAVGVLSAAVYLLRRKSLPDSVLFAAVALTTSVAGYAAFLRILNYYTQAWYYIALAAFVACCMDVVFGAAASAALRLIRPLAALFLLCATTKAAWKEMPKRHTNVDFVASRIQVLAQAGDVILMPRWECAISFSRYYHGTAEVITLPPIEDHRFHRYDLVLAQMRTKDAELPVLKQMERALRSGHRVFFADVLPFTDTEIELPVWRPPFQDSKGTWHGGPYYAVWKVQAAKFLRDHSTRAGTINVSLPAGSEVQEFEELAPGVAEGWR